MKKLTEEQRERIRVNRERALAIRRRKEEERRKRIQGTPDRIVEVVKIDTGKDKSSGDSSTKTKELVTGGEKDGVPTEEEDIELEDFEMGASQFVSKKEASKMYCLPEGTLAICSFVEKSNPKSSRFSAMKLFYRTEIRRRARERYGGLDGLREERAKREKKRFERDFKCAEDIFEKRSKR